MGATTYDGHPVPGSEGQPYGGRLPAFSEIGLVEAVVVDRRYVDDPGNRFRNAVEYDVRDLRDGNIIPNVRTLQSKFGVLNGQEIVYHPASKRISGTSSVDKSTRSIDTDGDVVLVGFIGGSRLNAVILGGLAHASTSYGAKRVDGERRFTVHGETKVTMASDGRVKVERPTDSGTTTVQIIPDGDIFMDHWAGAKIHFDNTQVKVDGAADAGILLGFDATRHVMAGEDFVTKVSSPTSLAAATLAGVASIQAAAQASDAASGIATHLTTRALQALLQAIVVFASHLSENMGNVPTTFVDKVRVK